MAASPASAVARRAFSDSRVRNLSFAVFFFLLAYANAAGYRNTYKTVADRLQFARSFGENKAIRLFYGVPHDLLSTGGYVAWRVGGTMAIAAGVWGVFAAVRALRAEEDAGRQELVAAGIITRTKAFAAAMAACVAGAGVLWLGLFAGLIAGRLAAGPSAYLALGTVSVGLVFVGIGAVVSQLAATRRLALGIANGVFVVALVLRVVADTAAGLEWLRWLTPLGWAEEMRAFTGARPAVLLLPLVATLALGAGATAIARRRDLGAGVIRSRDAAPPDLRLLSSPTALALRDERGSLIGWHVGVGFFAVIVGLLSTSFSNANIPQNVQQQLEKFGGASITTASGALGFYFLMFVFAISLFVCAQVAAARRDEAEQQLETLLALPVARNGWLGGRLALALGGAASLGLTAGVLAWLGATVQGADVSLGRMLEAGINCLPTAALFLGLAALGFALAPRASGLIAYGLVSLAFVWELFGSLLSAPGWLVGATPFHHIGLVPAQSLRLGAAAVMVGLATLAGAGALWAFRRRDLSVG